MFTRFYTKYNVSEYNFTINYSKIPKVLLGHQMTPYRPADLKFDTPRTTTYRLDPRTCPSDIAHCYQILDRPVLNRTSTGKNYTSLSTYQLPPSRIRTYVCVGNDTACVKKSTSCYCPEIDAPPPPYIFSGGKCTEMTHICLKSFNSFTLCRGNVTECRKRYEQCNCGTYFCVSNRNTCINDRDEIVMCANTLSTCLQQYKTCFCGPDMMLAGQGCTTSTHKCWKGNTTASCSGPFDACALQFDRCEC
jgi:hypothetical protein